MAKDHTFPFFFDPFPKYSAFLLASFLDWVKLISNALPGQQKNWAKHLETALHLLLENWFRFSDRGGGFVLSST